MITPFYKKSNHSRYLARLPKLPLAANEVTFLYSTDDFRQQLLTLISSAKTRIYLTALYLEQDEAGQEVMAALYAAKQHNPALEIKILVDWHRAQRGRIGEKDGRTNADFYAQLAKAHQDNPITVFGIPINSREMLGVLHLKGFVIDDTLLYSGASINNVYLHKQDKYRYDRYQIIRQPDLADSLVNYIDGQLIANSATQILTEGEQPTAKAIRADIRYLRAQLMQANYQFDGLKNTQHLAITPIVGLGKKNALNKTIRHLFNSTADKLTICTPYFNLPKPLVKDLIHLLKKGKQVEIIIGDKTANDFYIPESEPFRIIGGLPYLYEMNIRHFVQTLQNFVDNKQLTVRLWKDDENSYHLKGVWVDDEWILLTGNNLNPRAWRLDLENGMLIHDPQQMLKEQVNTELTHIRENTLIITHYQQIQASRFYPIKVKRLLNRIKRVRFDRLIKRLL